jgi:hypothetical protein
MRSSFLALFIAALSLGAAPAFGDSLGDLSISLVPDTGSGSPAPGTVDSGDCTLYSYCVLFSGTLTDNDTDASLLFVTGFDVSFTPTPGTGSLLPDGTFGNDAQTVFIGDPTSSFPTYSYSGAIFGIDIAPGTPLGEYAGVLSVYTSGGTNDLGDGQTFTAPFTVDVVAPEPSAASLIFAGLLPFVFWRGVRRKWLSSEAHRDRRGPPVGK